MVSIRVLVALHTSKKEIYQLEFHGTVCAVLLTELGKGWDKTGLNDTEGLDVPDIAYTVSKLVRDVLAGPVSRVNLGAVEITTLGRFSLALLLVLLLIVLFELLEIP